MHRKANNDIDFRLFLPIPSFFILLYCIALYFFILSASFLIVVNDLGYRDRMVRLRCAFQFGYIISRRVISLKKDLL